MAEKTRPKGYVSAVPNTVVPRIYIDDSAGAIVGAAGRNLGAAISGLGSAFKNVEAVQKRAQAADLEADYSNWDFQLETELTDFDRQAPVNQSNRYEQADSLIQQRTNDFLGRVEKASPEQLPAWRARLTERANSYRGVARERDFQRKTGYFTDRTKEVLDRESLRLENNPSHLPRAKEVLENLVLNTPDEYLDQETKVKLLAAGNEQLDAIAYKKQLYDEQKSGYGRVRERAGEIGGKLSNADRGVPNVNVSARSKEYLKGVAPETQAVYYDVASKYGDLGIRSGYRDPGHNEKVGGAKNSQHTHAKALDIQTDGMDPATRSQLLQDLYNDPRVGGIGLYESGAIHVDTRPRAAGAPPAIWGAGNSYSADPAELKALERDFLAGNRKAPSWKQADDGQSIGQRIAFAESSSNPNAPGGLAQAKEAAWMDFMRKRHGDLIASQGRDVLKYRDDRRYNEEFIDWYVGELTTSLKNASEPATDANIYTAYVLGPSGGPRMIKAPGAELAMNHASPEAVAANPALFKNKDGTPRTVNEFMQLMGDKMGQSSLESATDSDPQYNNLPWETRMAAREDVQRRLAQENAQEQAQFKQENESMMNEALFGIREGTFGAMDIQQMADSGRFDYDDIAKMDAALEKRNGDLRDVTDLLGRLQDNGLVNMDDSKDANAINQIAKAGGIEDAIGKRDAQKTLDILQATSFNGAGAPKDYIQQIRGGMYSRDWATTKYARNVLSAWAELNPEMADKLLNEEDIKQVGIWKARSGYYDDESMKQLIGFGEGPMTRQAKEAITEASSDYAKKEIIDPKKWGNVVERMFDGWFEAEPVNMRMRSEATMALQSEYVQLFQDIMTSANGKLDAEGAQTIVEEMISKRWGVTNTTKDGKATIMKYPPEMIYKNVTSAEMDKDVRTAYSIPFNSTYELVADEFTESEVLGKKNMVTYGVVVYDENGVAQKAYRVGDERIEFDTLNQAAIGRQSEINKQNFDDAVAGRVYHPGSDRMRTPSPYEKEDAVPELFNLEREIELNSMPDQPAIGDQLSPRTRSKDDVRIRQNRKRDQQAVDRANEGKK